MESDELYADVLKALKAAEKALEASLPIKQTEEALHAHWQAWTGVTDAIQDMQDELKPADESR